MLNLHSTHPSLMWRSPYPNHIVNIIMDFKLSLTFKHQLNLNLNDRAVLWHMVQSNLYVGLLRHELTAFTTNLFFSPIFDIDG